jgi:hypothetical protein
MAGYLRVCFASVNKGHRARRSDLVASLLSLELSGQSPPLALPLIERSTMGRIDLFPQRGGGRAGLSDHCCQA